MSVFLIPPDKQIDPAKLAAWIQMNTSQRTVHSPGPVFIYTRDIEVEPAGPVIDPVQFQAMVEEKAVRTGDPTAGVPFIYLDDLMDGFHGTRLEPDDVIHDAAVERHRQE